MLAAVNSLAYNTGGVRIQEWAAQNKSCGGPFILSCQPYPAHIGRYPAHDDSYNHHHYQNLLHTTTTKTFLQSLQPRTISPNQLPHIPPSPPPSFQPPI